ncbi:hypothetical protein BJX70DRAFT_326676 [Aspergillus crustosus]
MGQRHNRRRTRTRPRSRSRNRFNDIDPPPSAISSPVDIRAAFSFPAYASDCFGKRPVSTRHYRALTWQGRELILKPETAMMETEQYRLFGGEPGDDLNLCYRMLEYFGGLDYIDSLQEFNRLPG